ATPAMPIIRQRPFPGAVRGRGDSPGGANKASAIRLMAGSGGAATVEKRWAASSPANHRFLSCGAVAQFARVFGRLLAARILRDGRPFVGIPALNYEFPEPIKKEDRPRYLAALERLPKGSAAKPHVYFVSIYDSETDPHWRVTFTDGCVQYQCLRRFAAP